MTDKNPIDAVLRSRVADLLHLLQFARIETPTAGDAEQAEKAVNDLERMLAAPAAAAEPEPVAWGAFPYSGKRAGKLYAHADTEAMIEAYILDVHRSNDSLTLRKGPLYTTPPAAQQPDTVAVPRALLAEAESIIESYAEALKASHAPGGDWDGEEVAQDDYERESRVAAELRALLAGGEE